MERTSHGRSAREALRMQLGREELVERIAGVASQEGRVEPLTGLTFNRCSVPTEPLHVVAHPCLCIIGQGSKEVHLGESRYRYDPYQYLLVTAELPLVGHVLQASQEQPYLSLRLDLDSTVVSSVMVEAGHPSPPSRGDVRAIDVSPLSADLLDAVVRLVRLLEAPAEAPVLAPLITREIVYRLLTGEQGTRLRHIAVLGGHSHRIARAVKRLRADFDQSILIEGLAEEIGMSTSGFYHHFKIVTGMSPLQFQKQLQLQEARRLLLAEDLDAATAGYRVGYNDASHFNREYKRLFGRPPMRDVERLREARRESAT
jgi:AraC-like DNA-binding protein